MGRGERQLKTPQGRNCLVEVVPAKVVTWHFHHTRPKKCLASSGTEQFQILSTQLVPSISTILLIMTSQGLFRKADQFTFSSKDANLVQYNVFQFLCKYGGFCKSSHNYV